MISLKSCLPVLVVAVLAACGDKKETVPAAPPAARPASALKPEALKAAWVYVGPVADAGWNYAHERARQAVAAGLGDKVQTVFVENVRDAPNAERVTRDLAAKGNKIIFVTDAGFVAQTTKVAAEFPDVKFEQLGARISSDNLQPYEARLHECAYLAGAIAGRMTKSNTLGFVGSFARPDGLRDLNAFTLGALSVNPRIRARVVWIDAWFDPPKESDAAQRLIDGGADVLLQNTYSTAVLQTAEKNGKHAFGWNSDMSAFAPNAHLASCVVDWAQFYRRASESVMDGSWNSARIVGGIREAQVQLVGIADSVTADTKSLLDKLRAGMADESFSPYRGPVLDNRGRQHLAAGKVADQAWLDKVDFYVKGVDGEVPGRP